MKWKPAKRPPKESGRVIVSDGDNVSEAIYYANNKNHKWLSVDLTSNYDKTVTHWCDLPKSPNQLRKERLKIN